jgi:hypothetical protein
MAIYCMLANRALIVVATYETVNLCLDDLAVEFPRQQQQLFTVQLLSVELQTFFLIINIF